MRVVSVFNRYAIRGGEEEVFEAEAEMLTRHGCQVIPVSTKTVPPEGLLSPSCLWSAHHLVDRVARANQRFAGTDAPT